MSKNGAKSIEIERKYEVPKGVLLPSDFAEAGFNVVTDDTFQLEAHYFDTVDFVLAQNRVALRKRTGGDDAGWHIKAKAAVRATEYFWPLQDDIPEAALIKLQELVSQQTLELKKIARLSTRRRQLKLENKTGSSCFLVDDRVASFDYTTDYGQEWREWELELGVIGGSLDTHSRHKDDETNSGAGEALFAKIEPVLFAAGASPSASFSKIGRAMRSKR